MTSIAQHILLAENLGCDSVLIDGRPFPWRITPDVEIEDLSLTGDPLYAVTITLYADAAGQWSRWEAFYSPEGAKAEGRRIAMRAVEQNLGGVIRALEETR